MTSSRAGGFPGGSDSKESACNVGDMGLISGLERSLGGGHGNPLQYSCLDNTHGQRSLVDYSLWGHKESSTAKSVSLSWGAREVGSPCEWRGGARHCSRATVGESGLETAGLPKPLARAISYKASFLFNTALRAVLNHFIVSPFASFLITLSP